MRFRRLKLTHFAGVDEVEVTFASTGVTLIVGPNEAGKTSLTKAVDLLFDRLDSSAAADARAARPVHVDEGPEVELEVECGDYVFTYSKRWHRRPQTKLEVARPRPESLTGREAHERVRQILADTVDLDLWKSLRIQQGEELSQPTGLLSHGSLTTALDGEAGQSFADPAAESLLSRAEAEYQTYYSPTGKERDALKKPARELEDLEGRLAETREKLRGLERDVDRDAELDRRIGELEESLPAAERRLEEAEEAVRLVTAREQKLKHARELAEAAGREAARARRELDERRELAAEVEGLAAAAAEKEKRAAQAASPRERAERLARESAKALDVASRAFEEAREVERLRREDLEYERARLDAAQLGERLARVEKAEASATAARELLGRETIDAEVLKRLRDLGLAVERARAVLEVGSPRLVLEAHRAVEWKEAEEKRSLAAGESHEIVVTESHEIEVGDLLTIRVQPGEDSDGRIDGLRDAEKELAEELARHEVGDVDAAAGRLNARAEAERAVAHAREIREENLRDLTLEELRAKLHRVEDRAARPPARGEGAPPAPGSFDEAQRLLNEAVEAAKDRETALEAARREAETRREKRDKAAGDAAEVVKASELAARDLERRRRDLRTARESEGDDALAERARLADEEAEKRRGTVGDLEKRLDLDDPEATRAGLDGAKSALARIRAEHREAREERAGVRARLSEAGREGLAERVEELASKRERAGRDLRLAQERAAAAKLLFETLNAARAEARQAYATPLATRIRRLGRQVFGESFDVTLGDDLEIVDRTLDGRVVPFESLSGGAREQLSVISRVAAAMLVAKDGGVPVILDDALGYTDPERLRSMATVLTLAGRECQVVLLTCDPDRYREIADPHEVRLG